MEKLKIEVTEWVEKATKIRLKYKDEAYAIMEKIIKKYGRDEGKNIVINLEGKYGTILVMEHDDYEGGYIARDIERIEFSKKYGGICLVYGEDDYDYIKYSDVLLSDRIFIIQTLMSYFS